MGKSNGKIVADQKEQEILYNVQEVVKTCYTKNIM